MCELPIPPGAASVTIGGRAIDLPPPSPRRIAVLGDAGCRLKATDGFQACNDPEAWPFRRVADSIRAYNPDLIIHVGDYLYREDACPVGNAGCAGSPFGDTWATWQADLFAPAQVALPAAPWVWIRGDHETCERGGNGWFRYLDPRPVPAACQEFTDPYTMMLGNLQIQVLDSAQADDDKAPENLVATYRRQLESLRQVTAGNAWLVTHHPIWGALDDGKGRLTIRNATLQAATNNALPAEIGLVLSGHIHFFEELSFGGGRPPQLVVGNGGTSLLTDVREPLAGVEIAGAPVETGRVIDEFGFLTLEAGGADRIWFATVRDTAGAPITVCRIEGTTVACAP